MATARLPKLGSQLQEERRNRTIALIDSLMDGLQGRDLQNLVNFKAHLLTITDSWLWLQNGDNIKSTEWILTCSKAGRVLPFHLDNWISIWGDYDKKNPIFKGIDKKEYNEAVYKAKIRYNSTGLRKTRTQRFQETLKRFESIPYIFEGDYMDDFSRYQRPSNNGIGYVAICPGERGNNIYVEDPYTVKALTRRYESFLKANNLTSQEVNFKNEGC